MRNFKHTLGVLSRDMLFLSGHFMSFQGLDGAAGHKPVPRNHKIATTGSKPSSTTCSVTCQR